MPEDIIAKLILTLQQHSTLSLFFVFLAAFSESLIVIGLIVPGAILKKERIKEINFKNKNLIVHKKTVFNQKENEKSIIFLLQEKL